VAAGRSRQNFAIAPEAITRLVAAHLRPLDSSD
jgi:hypothetical protein